MCGGVEGGDRGCRGGGRGARPVRIQGRCGRGRGSCRSSGGRLLFVGALFRVCGVGVGSRSRNASGVGGRFLPIWRRCGRILPSF